MSTFNINEFEEIPASSVAASKILTDMWARLGKPNTPFTPSGEKLMNIIISVWYDLYPKEAIGWEEDRKEYKKSELSITEQVHKRTGRSLASYPSPIYYMMKKLFKGFEPAKRENCMKMVKKWPMFRFANRA